MTYSLQSQFMSSVAAGGAGLRRFVMILLQIIVRLGQRGRRLCPLADVVEHGDQSV